jgi:hypothetical protein
MTAVIEPLIVVGLFGLQRNETRLRQYTREKVGGSHNLVVTGLTT